MPSRIQLSRVCVAMLLALSAGVAQAQAPKVLDQVPGDAPMAIVVRDLSQLSAKLAMLNEKLALDSAEMMDGLGMLKMMMGLEKGLDDKGSMALVMASVPDPNGGAEPDMLILVPVTDYKAFLGNFDAAAGDDAAVTQMELNGQPSFAKKAGSFAVVSNKRETVAGYAGGAGDALVKRVGAIGADALGRSDIHVYIDMEKLGPVIQPMLQQGLAQAQQQIEAQGGPEAELTKAMMRLMGGSIQAIVRDGQALVLGADLSEEGLGLSAAAQFKPGSPLAQQFAKAPSKPLAITKLPTRPYMFAMAMDMDALPLKKWMGDVAAAMPKDHMLGAIMKNSAASFEAMKGTMQSAYYGPQPGGGGPPSLFSAVSVVETDNPDQYIAAAIESMTALNGKDLGQGLSMTTTYQKNVMQVAGHEVDQYTTQYKIPQELAAQLGPAVALLGGGQTGYITKTPNAVVMTNGADPVLIKEAIDAAKGAGKGLEADAGIAAVRKHLPQNRVAETYIGIGTVMQTVNGILGMLAPDMVVPMPANLPPLASSASVDAGGVSVREWVPMPVMVAVKNAAMKFAQARGAAGAVAPQRPAATTTNAPAKAPPAPASKNLFTLTADNFDAVALKSDKPVLVCFLTSWDQNCKAQAPVLSKIADQYAGKVVVGTLDVDKQQATADAYNITAVPTTFLIKGGKVVTKLEGVTYEPKLTETIEAALK